ncbi:MAG: ABC transporter substrate-binding protein [Bacteroidales bacterium]|nr:ABC transporter substrate-binding protein [Bacteroidales bacterium]
MNKIFFLAIILVALMLNACNNNENDNVCKNSEAFGTLSIGESGYIELLYPLSINSSISNQIVSLIHEGLVKFDAASLTIKPGLADRWEIDKDETTYRFFLNTNAYFHPDKCFKNGKSRKVTAQDVLFSLTRLCTQSPENKAYALLVEQVKGAKEFYDSKKTTGNIEGFIVENDSTFVIKLTKPNPMFLHFLANPAASIIAKEAYEMYNTSLTNGIGPFMLHSFPENNKPLVLIRNPHYFKLDRKGNCLPYLDTVKIYFVGSMKAQLEMLKNGQLDVVLNIDNETFTSFLEENVKLFEGEKAVFKAIADQNQSRQHIVNSKVENFILNEQGIFDLSEVKLKKDSL